MAQRYWKVQKSGELSAAEAAAMVGESGHTVLRTEIAKGKTTVYFTGDAKDARGKALRSKASEVKPAELTKG